MPEQMQYQESTQGHRTFGFDIPRELAHFARGHTRSAFQSGLVRALAYDTPGNVYERSDYRTAYEAGFRAMRDGRATIDPRDREWILHVAQRLSPTARDRAAGVLGPGKLRQLEEAGLTIIDTQGGRWNR